MRLFLCLALACAPSESGPRDAGGSSGSTVVTGTGSTGHPSTPGTTPAGTPSTPGTTPTGTTDTTDTDTVPGDTAAPPDDGCGVPRIRINEVSPSNGGAVVDADGDTSDWIEIYNGTFDGVDLTGWHLSDDDAWPDRWPFPPMVIGPGETLLVFASGKDAGEPVASWRTVVDHGHLWSYLPVVEPPPADWAAADFDDSAWGVGPSGFGRGDGDDATEVDAHTIYVRTDVVVDADDLAELTTLWLHVDHDDGFVAWLNGEELVRDGVSGADPAWDAWVSDGGQEAQLYQGRSAPGYDVSFAIDRLRVGRNVLAIEVHDASAESSDLSLIPFLTFGFASVRGGAPSPELDLGRREDAPHTNFSLSLSGEPVVLTAPDGCVVDRVQAGGLRQDESWGRMPDGGDLGVFLEPTPGERNTTEWRPGFARTPDLWPEPGFYPNGTAISATAWDAQTTVRIELGGAVPTEDSLVFMPGVGTSGEATVVRARGFAEGLWPSRVATGTYLVREPPEVAVVSLVLEPDDFLGVEDGMYLHYWDDWEKEAHVSMFDPGGDGFALDAGLKVHGAASREFGQKSLRLVMRSDYGTAAVEYPVFAETDRERHDRLILRNAGHDTLGCSPTGCMDGAHMRDAVAHRLVADIDVDSMASRPVLTYINGEPWGLYNLRERLDSAWIANNHGVDDVDILEWEYSVVEGDNDHWIGFMATLRTLDPLSPEAWEHVQAHLDVAEVANYHATQIFIANIDWPGNNRKWWRPRTPEGRYRFLLYDTDFGLGRGGLAVSHDTLAFALETDGGGWANAPWATELLRLLVEVPEFRQEFVNRYADLLNTVFSAESTAATLDGFIAERQAAIPVHLERWGHDDALGPFVLQVSAWEYAVGGLSDWLRDRPFYARLHLEDNLELDGTFALSLAVSPPGSGSFRLSAVDVEGGFEGTYFLGNPVRVEALPADGFVFVGWDDPRLPPDPVVWVPGEEGGTVLTARFE